MKEARTSLRILTLVYLLNVKVLIMHIALPVLTALAKMSKVLLVHSV